MLEKTTRELLKILTILLLTSLLFSGTSCKTGSKLAGKGKIDQSLDALSSQLFNNQLQADWFSAKAKIDFDDGYLAISGNASVKLKKDSILWMNIKKLGIELARVQITPDSVYIIDRFNSEFAILPIKYLEEEYNIPADFNSLQSLILGNPMFFSDPPQLKLTEKQGFQLQETSGFIESFYSLEGKSNKLLKMLIESDRATRSLKLSYSDFKPVSGKQIFPYICTLDINSPETGNVDIGINFSKVEINVPKSIRFEIPDKYTRAQL